MSALHVTNGDCAAGTLRTFLTDPVRITCDVLHAGPAPDVDDDAWYDLRARFIANGFDRRYDDVRAGMTAFDRELASTTHDEIVLWFEHDLFDQLLLIRTLDVLGRSRTDARPVSLICIGEFPGIDRFIGLGQLNAEQLASLYPHRVRVTDGHYALASRAWRAFRANDPRELLTITSGQDLLPFLDGAMRRLLEEYPSTANGLSRTANAILHALANGPLDGSSLFSSTQRHEMRPFMGDWGFFDVVHHLASQRAPLVTISPAPAGVPLDLRDSTIALTGAGRDVLAGRADAITLSGIDEWRGGVRLLGADRSPWRWDPNRETLVS